MSTLRISNIEAKSVPASATIDEKIKITNSSGDPLVFIDGKRLFKKKQIDYISVPHFDELSVKWMWVDM